MITERPTRPDGRNHRTMDMNEEGQSDWAMTFVQPIEIAITSQSVAHGQARYILSIVMDFLNSRKIYRL